MAWALQRAAREKQSEGQEKHEEGQKEQEEECEAALNAKLAARGVDLSLRTPPPRAYANIRQDIAGLGGGATFGDVMNLLRQGPQGQQHAEMRQQARRGGVQSGAAVALAPQNKREHALAARSMLDGIKAMQTMLAAGEDPTRTALAMRSQLSTLMGGGSSSSLPSVGSSNNGSPSKANARSRAPPHLPSRHRGNAAGFLANRSGGANSEENMPPIEGNGHANAAAAFRSRQVAAGKKPSSRDNGSFGVPQGADIRTKGSTEHWTARKRTRDEWTEEEKKADEEKQEQEEKEAAAASAQNGGGGGGTTTKGILDLIQAVDDKIDRKLNKRETAVADLSTSVNVCVVQSTRHRSHVFVGLGCGDVRVIDLGPNTTLPSDLPEESATLAPPLLLAGHKGYVGALVAVGQLCFSGSFDGSIRGWKYSDEKVVVQSTAHRAPVHGLCYSASNRKVYSCSSDGTVRVWDLAAGKSRSLSEHFSCPCFSITLSEKRQALFVGLEDGSIAVVDARSGAVIRDLKGHAGMVSALHFSPKANVLASASVDGTCRVWFAGQCIVEYTEHECPLYAIALLQGGTYAVSGGSDGTIHRWNCSTGKTTTVYRSGIADTIFSLVPHRGRLLSSGRDGVVRFWKASSPCEFCEERCDCAMVGHGAVSAGRSGGGSSSSSSSRTGGGDCANISVACMYQIVSCPNAGCSLKCARCDLQRHAGDCAYREMRCPNPGCKETMPHAELKAHNDRDCPYAKVKCPNAAVNGGWGCVAALRRRHLAEHVLLCRPPEEAEAPPPSPRSAAGGAMAAIKQQKGGGKKRKKVLARKKKKGFGSTSQGNRTKIALRNSRAYREQLRRKRREEEDNRRRRDAEEEEEKE